MDIAEQILALPDIEYSQVTCEKWVIDGKPVVITVRSMGSKEQTDFEKSLVKTVKRYDKKGKLKTENKQDLTNVKAKLVAKCACKAVGDPTPIFTVEQVEKLGSKNAAMVDLIYSEAQRLNGYTETEEDVEEFVGNSTPVQPTDS